MDAHAYATGLRAIADWYDANPDAPVNWDPTINVSAADTAEEARRIARLLGRCEKEYRESTFALTRDFGGVNLSFVFWRSTVCTRRVVGTRVVPAKPATAEREEEIIEWDCNAILAEETP